MGLVPGQFTQGGLLALGTADAGRGLVGGLAGRQFEALAGQQLVDGTQLYLGVVPLPQVGVVKASGGLLDLILSRNRCVTRRT